MWRPTKSTEVLLLQVMHPLIGKLCIISHARSAWQMKIQLVIPVRKAKAGFVADKLLLALADASDL